MINRRSILAGLGAGLFAPAIIRTTGLLMPASPTLKTRLITAPRSEFYSLIPLGIGGFVRKDPQTGIWHEFGLGSDVYMKIMELERAPFVWGPPDAMVTFFA